MPDRSCGSIFLSLACWSRRVLYCDFSPCADATVASDNMTIISVKRRMRSLSLVRRILAVVARHDLLAVREDDLDDDRGGRTVGGGIDDRGDRLADLQRVPVVAFLRERADAGVLETPRHDLPVGVLHVHVDQDVRIAPLDFRDGPL